MIKKGPEDTGDAGEEPFEGISPPMEEPDRDDKEPDHASPDVLDNPHPVPASNYDPDHWPKF